MKRFDLIWIVIILSSVTINSTIASNYSLGSSGFELSGDIALTFREFDKHSALNRNNRGDDPFNSFRSRLFLTKNWNPNIGMNVELLFDQRTQRINGAYMTFSNILTPALSSNLGLIPSPFGNFGHRSTYFNLNPVIGVPAMWHYHTPLLQNGRSDNASFFPRKVKVGSSVPPAYDACWPTGMTLEADLDSFEIVAAITHNTFSNPKAYDNLGYEGILKLAARPTNGLYTGVSVAYGPWIGSSDTTFTKSIEDYYQTACSVVVTSQNFMFSATIRKKMM